MRNHPQHDSAPSPSVEGACHSGSDTHTITPIRITRGTVSGNYQAPRLRELYCAKAEIMRSEEEAQALRRYVTASTAPSLK